MIYRTAVANTFVTRERNMKLLQSRSFSNVRETTTFFPSACSQGAQRKNQFRRGKFNSRCDSPAKCYFLSIGLDAKYQNKKRKRCAFRLFRNDVRHEPTIFKWNSIQQTREKVNEKVEWRSEKFVGRHSMLRVQSVDDNTRTNIMSHRLIVFRNEAATTHFPFAIHFHFYLLSVTPSGRKRII